MAKFQREHTWNVTIDGVQHEVYCRFEGNRYVLYADDDHVANVYRKSAHTMWYGMEEPVTMFGKPCIFIVWDEKPDIVVDGRIIGRGVDYEKALAKKNNRPSLGYWIIFWAGVFLLLVVAALVLTKWRNITSWRDYIIGGTAAIWMIFWSVKNLVQLTHGENRSIIAEDKSKGANSNEL